MVYPSVAVNPIMTTPFKPCGDNPDAMCNGGKGRGLWCTPACLAQEHQRNYNYYTDPNMPCGEIILPTVGACTLGTNDKGEIDLPRVTYAEAKVHPSYEAVKLLREAWHALARAGDHYSEGVGLPSTIQDELSSIRHNIDTLLEEKVIPHWRNASGFNPDIL